VDSLLWFCVFLSEGPKTKAPTKNRPITIDHKEENTMSEFRNTVVADLRNITSVEAAQAIESIENCAALILPIDGDPAVMEALARIPQKNIATTLYLEKGVPVCHFNGSIQLTAPTLQKDQVVIVNGSAIVPEPVADCKMRLIANGTVIYPKTCAINVLEANGSCAGYDYEHYVSIDDDLRLTPELLDLVDYKTLFDIDGDLRLSPQISLEELKEKMPYFIVDGDVRCNREQAPFIQLRGEVDGDLRVKGAVYDDDEDEEDDD